ncbi:hypothetical protein [Lactobacillus paragasseri]|uniref:hypothetical protein n=1 Tax=Lactobacillus paragasseri TaxID=2107999 RepID=UPI00237F288D|nr:hypothetical protein [Lactobacillus paragasseri]MDE3334776.1 hypothetical protein [Lactobacillus paragasseri]MDE3397649.1 hypothetical protein [Lactobacillus paragasseri]
MEKSTEGNLASPLIPNPGIFKKLVQTAASNDGLRIVESPVTQVEIIFDRYANKAEVYDDFNQNTIPIGKFKETLSVPDIIRKMISILGNSNCNLVYLVQKSMPFQMLWLLVVQWKKVTIQG